jgi:hypothetical protein
LRALLRACGHGPISSLVYRDDGHLIGRTTTIHAANDPEAIAQAEVMRGSWATELLDIEGLRIVKYLPRTGGGSPPQARASILTFF